MYQDLKKKKEKKIQIYIKSRSFILSLDVNVSMNMNFDKFHDKIVKNYLEGKEKKKTLIIVYMRTYCRVY